MKRTSVLVSTVAFALAASALIAPAASAQQDLVDTTSGARTLDYSGGCVAARITANSSESVTQVVLDLREQGTGSTSNTGVWLVEDNSGSIGSNVLGYYGYSTGSIYAQGTPTAITSGTSFWVIFKQDVPSLTDYVRAYWTSAPPASSGPWSYDSFTVSSITVYLMQISTCSFSGFSAGDTATLGSQNPVSNHALKVKLVGTGSGGSSSASDASSQIPAPVMQQVGMPSTGCTDYDDAELNIGGAGSGGWGQSWAQWVNDGEGGAVCTRTLVYSPIYSLWTVG